MKLLLGNGRRLLYGLYILWLTWLYCFPEIILLLLWFRCHIPKIIWLLHRLDNLLYGRLILRWHESKILLFYLFCLSKIKIKVPPHLIFILGLHRLPSKLLILYRLSSLVKHFKRILLLFLLLNWSLLSLKLLRAINFWSLRLLLGLFLWVLYFLFNSF